MTAAKPLLEIEDLDVSYQVGGAAVLGLKDVSVAVGRSRILGVVGESGSGKSTLSIAITRLLPPNARIASGRILFDGTDVAALSQADLRALRGDKIAMVFQDPLSSLHPCLTIGRQMLDAQRAHGRRDNRALRQNAVDMLSQVGISDAADRLNQYPHEFSGGMRQRLMIAMALLMRPALLIADEPTSALDVTLQSQIIALLGDLRDRFGTAVILVSHDLGVISQIVDDVLVMYAGEAVESGGVDATFREPLHPYTIALLEVIPRRARRGQTLATIPGRVPAAGERPKGCAFTNRCAFARAVCVARRPGYLPVGERRVRCHIHDPSSGWHAQEPLAGRQMEPA